MNLYLPRIVVFGAVIFCQNLLLAMEKEGLDNSPSNASLTSQTMQIDKEKSQDELLFNDSISKIREIISKQNPKVELLIKHIKNHKETLVPYLTRPYEHVHFDHEDRLSVSEEENFLYTLMAKIGWEVPFRKKQKPLTPMPSPFYTLTLSSAMSSATLKKEGTSISPKRSTFYTSFLPIDLVEFENISIDTSKCKIIQGMDIYQTRELLCDFELNNIQMNCPILLTPNSKDEHTTLTVHFLDLEKQRVLTSLFINSSPHGENFNYFKRRFNFPGYYYRTVESASEVKKRFPFVSIIKNDGISCDWDIPMIDCSSNLQVSSNDNNCSLYVYDYTVALSQFLSDPEIFTQVFHLAKQLFDNSHDQTAANTLQTIINENTKRYLPQYYHKDGTRKSVDEIKAYHMKLRWSLSSEWLKRKLNS